MSHILGGIGHGKTVEEEIAQRTPRPASSTTLPEGVEAIPIVIDGQIIGYNVPGFGFLTPEEFQTLSTTGKFPEEPSGPGRAPPSFASSQAAQTQQEEFLAAQNAANIQADKDAAAARVQADIEADRLAQEGADRRERLG